MNKGITLLILLVVFAAMGLVMYSHMDGKKTAALTAQNTQQTRTNNRGHGLSTPMRAPQGETASLPTFQPPLSSEAPRSESAPRPVTVKPGSNGNPAQRVEAAVPRETATAPQAVTPPASTRQPEPITPKAQDKTADQPKKEKEPAAKQPASTAPGLTPLTDLGAAKEKAPEKPATTEKDTQPKAPANGPRTLEYIQVASIAQGVQLRIDADGPIRCKTFTLSSPDRLVVDLTGTWKGMRAPAVPADSVVQKVRLGQQASGPRLVLDLKSPLKNHRVERTGNSVKIIMQ